MTAHIDETDGVFFNDRTAATDEEFAARIAPFGIFEPEEREAAVIEEVARAIAQTDYESPIDADAWEYAFREDERDDFHRYAAAAVAAYRAARDGGAEEAVRRVEALAEEFDEATVPPIINDFDRGLVAGYARAAARIRAALAPQADR